MSKSDFFERLDLTSYEGRAAANNLVKRLGARISVVKLERMNECYAVIVEGTVSFLVYNRETAITIRSVDTDILDKQVTHGEITQDQRVRLEQIREMGDVQGPTSLVRALFNWEHVAANKVDNG